VETPVVVFSGDKLFGGRRGLHRGPRGAGGALRPAFLAGVCAGWGGASGPKATILPTCLCVTPFARPDPAAAGVGGGVEAPRRLEARVGPLTVTGEAREALDPNRLSRSRGWSNLTGWGDQR
jgi:hypothetical protein